MHDPTTDIEDIKKEIIESRGLTIKTNNLVNSLASDVKSIAKRQTGYERRFAWNGAAAYVLFTLLCFAGLKLASDARINEASAEKDRLKSLTSQLQKELSEEKRRSERRERAELRANQFYNLIRKQEREEVVKSYEELRKAELSQAEEAFFRDIVERFRRDLSVVEYNKGLNFMRTGRYANAAEALQRAITLGDEAPHVPAVRLELAVALRRLDRCSEAVVLSKMVLEQNLEKELHDDATWLQARCAEELGQFDEARSALKTLLRRWPRSSFAGDARKKFNELKKR